MGCDAVFGRDACEFLSFHESFWKERFDGELIEPLRPFFFPSVLRVRSLFFLAAAHGFHEVLTSFEFLSLLLRPITGGYVSRSLHHQNQFSRRDRTSPLPLVVLLTQLTFANYSFYPPDSHGGKIHTSQCWICPWLDAVVFCCNLVSTGESNRTTPLELISSLLFPFQPPHRDHLGCSYHRLLD